MTTLIESYEQQYSNLSAEITVTVGKIGNSIGGIGFQLFKILLSLRTLLLTMCTRFRIVILFGSNWKKKAFV